MTRDEALKLLAECRYLIRDTEPEYAKGFLEGYEQGVRDSANLAQAQISANQSKARNWACIHLKRAILALLDRGNASNLEKK